MSNKEISEGEIIPLGIEGDIFKFYHASPYSFTNTSSVFHVTNNENTIITENFPLKVNYFKKTKTKLKDGIGKYREVDVNLDAYIELSSENYTIVPAIQNFSFTTTGSEWRFCFRFTSNFLLKHKEFKVYAENIGHDIIYEKTEHGSLEFLIRTWNQIDNIDIVIKSDKLLIRKRFKRE